MWGYHVPPGVDEWVDHQKGFYSAQLLAGIKSSEHKCHTHAPPSESSWPRYWGMSRSSHIVAGQCSHLLCPHWICARDMFWSILRTFLWQLIISWQPLSNFSAAIQQEPISNFQTYRIKNGKSCNWINYRENLVDRCWSQIGRKQSAAADNSDKGFLCLQKGSAGKTFSLQNWGENCSS